MVIKCKVAAIVNEREIVINKGAEAGVKPDMKFKVMEPDIDVRDPDSGATLGTVTREKIRVKIADVQPKFAVGRTYETYLLTTGAPSDFFQRFRLGPRFAEITRVRTFRSDQSDALGPFDKAMSIIRVGDEVIELAE